jgi:hypothetical protein
MPRQIDFRIQAISHLKEITDRDLVPIGNALISTDMGTKQIGTWKIQGDKLCKSKEKTKPLISYEVWMSGDNISLRLHEEDDHFIGVVEKHGTD